MAVVVVAEEVAAAVVVQGVLVVEAEGASQFLL